MTVYTDLRVWIEERQRQRRAGIALGFVPTMGALHSGHLALVQHSRADNARTLVSIFVNPTQFNDQADLEAYPRPLETDLHLLQQAGVEYVLAPTAAQLYADRYRYRVTETEQSCVREGAARPGHFDGVLTVVLKFLHLADAERAYFGEKDWQQLELVRGLVDAFFLSTDIIAVPTLRDDDGLALSSRNIRLSENARQKAPLFPLALRTATSAAAARSQLEAQGFAVDYVEDDRGRRLGAVRLGTVRLIDNVPLGSDR